MTVRTRHGGWQTQNIVMFEGFRFWHHFEWIFSDVYVSGFRVHAGFIFLWLGFKFYNMLLQGFIVFYYRVHTGFIVFLCLGFRDQGSGSNVACEQLGAPSLPAVAPDKSKPFDSPSKSKPLSTSN